MAVKPRFLELPLYMTTVAVAGVMFMFSGVEASAASQKGPFASLLGSWSGSGQVRYADGTSGRMSCRGTYTGNSFRLKMTLRCFGSGNQVSINGQMRSTYGKVAGTWQENNFSLFGQVSGTASSGQVNLSISGGVNGSMSVSFGQSNQNVTVRTSGVSLESVTMSLRRSR